ncbi:MAG: hypothetical protein JW723_08430 [Bacteroidales bacterium]|nr:hypothetical protein [Bacteroidales bacterium]
MKKTVYYLAALIFLSVMIFQCEKESGENIKVNHILTVPGGCNGLSFDEIMLPRYEEKDTLQFYIRNDTLNVFIGINYICCAPFETGFSQSADSLFFTITDTCTSLYETCYCRCMCYYTFDFLFDSFSRKEYYFKIIINDPRQDEPIIFREGFVNLTYK